MKFEDSSGYSPVNFLFSPNRRLRILGSISAHATIAVIATNSHHHEAPLIKATPAPQVAATRNTPLTISALVLGHNILGRRLPGGHILIVPYRNHKATSRRIIPIANFILLPYPNPLAGLTHPWEMAYQHAHRMRRLSASGKTLQQLNLICIKPMVFACIPSKDQFNHRDDHLIQWQGSLCCRKS